MNDVSMKGIHLLRTKCTALCNLVRGLVAMCQYLLDDLGSGPYSQDQSTPVWSSEPPGQERWKIYMDICFIMSLIVSHNAMYSDWTVKTTFGPGHPHSWLFQSR